MPNDFQELTAYLKNARIESGLSQQELAQKLGYSTAQFVSNWERGLARPPLNASRRLISILKLDTEQYIDLYIKGTGRRIRKALKNS